MMPEQTWEQPKTSRIYLHPIYSERIIMLHPEMKITNLGLENMNIHINQKACGLHFLFGNNPRSVDFKASRFDKPRNGIPIYTVRNTDPENGCELALKTFCSSEKDPVCYAEITLTNNADTPVKGVVALLPRVTDEDHYLTNMFDTGYSTYMPNEKNWYLCRKYGFNVGESTVSSDNGYLTLHIEDCKGFDCRWVSKTEQKKRFEANDYFRCEYTAAPGQTLVLHVAFTHGKSKPEEFDVARKKAVDYWKKVLGKVKTVPDCDDSEKQDMYLSSITQSLQNLQTYPSGERPGAVYPRQGDVGRFIWIWEAQYFMSALERAGLAEYTMPAWKTLCEVWQEKEGVNKGRFITNRTVWSNFTGSAVKGISKRLLITQSKEEFEYFKPYIMNGIDYIQRMRGLTPESAEHTGRIGLFSVGVGSDWGELGQHWTYTDAVNADGIRFAAEAFERFDDCDAGYVRSVYTDYAKTINDLEDELFAGHENDEELTVEHILGVPFEDTWNHCFYTDGEPFLVLTGFLDPLSKRFEQMEAFYRNNGLFEHGLTGRMTNGFGGNPGVYGDVYYTGVPEINWLYAWLKRGETDKVRETAEAMLRYNLTEEYVSSERYCSFDPWYTPWQPNASGSGRIIDWLLDYYGEKNTK